MGGLTGIAPDPPTRHDEAIEALAHRKAPGALRLSGDEPVGRGPARTSSAAASRVSG